MTRLGGTPEGQQPQGLRPLRHGQHPVLRPLRRHHGDDPMPRQETRQPWNIGHFLLALDPGLFRDAADFRRRCPPPSAARCAPPSLLIPSGPSLSPAIRAPHRAQRRQNRHPRRPQPFSQGARHRARLRRGVDHGQMTPPADVQRSGTGRAVSVNLVPCLTRRSINHRARPRPGGRDRRHQLLAATIAAAAAW